MKSTVKKPNYQAMLSGLAIPYVAYDIDDPYFTVLEESQTHADLAGTRREDIIGKPLLEAFPTVSRHNDMSGKNKLLDSIRRVIKTGEPDVLPKVRYDMRDEEGNYTQRIWRVAHHPIIEKKKVVAVYQLAEDISEQNNAEKSLVFLTKATAQLSVSLDYKETLNRVASMAVPNIADWCTIDLLDDDGDLELLVVAHKDPAKVIWAKQLRAEQDAAGDEQTGLRAVLKSGKPEYMPVITDEMLVATAKDEKALELLRSVGFSSVIIVPMKIGGRPIGTLTLVSAESRVHFTKIDLETAIGFANWSALAIYNANLYQTAHQELEEREWLQEQLETANNILENRVRERTEQLQSTNMGLQQEIIKRKKIEAQRVQHLMKLNRSKDEFISIASHQLRTPATGVKQYVGMLLEGFAGDVTPTQLEMLEKAYESNERQLRIVSDLLKVAQVDAGKVMFSKSKVDLNELIRDVLHEQKDTFAKRQQHVHFEPANHPIVVFIDHDSMRMVCENIIDNASKYSEEGKSIVISVVERSGSACIDVKDEGVGIGKNDRNKLFEKFSRIDNPLSTKVGGTGLGLYWAKKIIDHHDGDITLKSRKGVGTTFTISVPKVGQK